MSRRVQRLSHLFREELSDIIRTELSDPRISEIMSITRVNVSADLENADAFVSVLGDAEEKASTIAALSHAAPFLRRHLLERIRIRRVPRLHLDRKSTRLNSSHTVISYAVFCLKKKK